MTPMTWFLILLIAAALVAFYFGIRSQMKRGQTLAGPLTPADMDKPLGGESKSADLHRGEGEGEKIADEYESSTNTLGHG